MYSPFEFIFTQDLDKMISNHSLEGLFPEEVEKGDEVQYIQGKITDAGITDPWIISYCDDNWVV